MSQRIQLFIESMDIRPSDRVLEIGCGHGVAASLVCQKLGRGGRYVGIDRSIKMIAAARKRIDVSVQSGVAELILSDLETLDLGEARFDKVFAQRVRLFFTDSERAHGLVTRWLAPAGKLFVEYDEPAPSG